MADHAAFALSIPFSSTNITPICAIQKCGATLRTLKYLLKSPNAPSSATPWFSSSRQELDAPVTRTLVGVDRRTAIFCLTSLAVYLSSSQYAAAMDSDATPPSKPFVTRRLFAESMEQGMTAYEKSVKSRKEKLFAMIRPGDNVVDIGIGTGPNLAFMPPDVHVIGVEPNEYMWPYAASKAKKFGVELDLVNGVAENLPFKDGEFDVAISTLTLCSVSNVTKSIEEVVRVLKPGGLFLFNEHVLASPSRPILRAFQNLLNPVQVLLSDGCHLNRQTGRAIKQYQGSTGFSQVALEDQDLLFENFTDVFGLIKPHVVGFALKAD